MNKGHQGKIYLYTWFVCTQLHSFFLLQTLSGILSNNEEMNLKCNYLFIYLYWFSTVHMVHKQKDTGSL